MSQDQTPIACARLAEELQVLRDRAGLSLAALAARTPFSKSSWARYLNGKALPPWQAVQALCTLAEEPQPKLRALWLLAEDAWSRRSAVAPPSAPPAAPTPGAAPAPAPVPGSPLSGASPVPGPAGNRTAAEVRRTRRIVPVAAGVLCGAVLLGVGATQAWHHLGGSTPSGVTTSSLPPVGCEGRSCDGADPTGMDCGVYPGPQSLADYQTPAGAELEIRYNPRCRAAWTRVRLSRAGDEISISIAGKDTRTALIPDQYSAQTYVYTPMVPTAPHGPPLQACLIPAGHGRPECFSVHQP
jgi:hypothetical protein